MVCDDWGCGGDILRELGANEEVMIMRTGILVTIFILTILLTPPPVAAQDTDLAILEIINLNLSLNEIHRTNVDLEPYAPHIAESNMSSVNTSVVESIVTIHITSESDSYHIEHYKEFLHHSLEFTPLVSYYQVDIRNEGHVNAVLVNLTIKQIGPPTTAFYSPEAMIFVVVVPLTLANILPIVPLIAVITLYKKKRRH